jgi:hypothetical protein
MGISTFPVAASSSSSSLPAGATSLVYAGNVGKGIGFYTTSLNAGNYIINVAPAEGLAYISANSPVNAYYSDELASFQNQYISLTTTESNFTVGAGLGTGKENRINLNTASGNTYGTPAFQSTVIIGTSIFFTSWNGSTTYVNKIVGTTAQTVSSAFATYTTTGSPNIAGVSAYGNSIGLLPATDILTNYYFRTVDAGVSWSRVGGATTATTQIFFGSNTNTFITVANSGNSTSSIYSCTDGVTWTARTVPTSNAAMYCGVYGNSAFVAAGASGTIISSTDGTTWAARTVAYTNTFRSATFGNGKFLVGGAVNNLTYGSAANGAYSTDGTTWTITSINGRGNQSNPDIGSYQLFFANGYYWYMDSGNIPETAPRKSRYILHFSTDAITWRTVAGENTLLSNIQSATSSWAAQNTNTYPLIYNNQIYWSTGGGQNYGYLQPLIPFTVSIYSAS